MTDEVCHSALRQLLGSSEPLTQRALAAVLPFDSSTISRRMGDLEELGLVKRTSAQAPYELLFPDETRELLRAGAALGRVARQTQADELQHDLDGLEAPTSTGASARRSGRAS